MVTAYDYMIKVYNRMDIVYDLCIDDEKLGKFSSFFKEYKLVGAHISLMETLLFQITATVVE